MVPDLCTRWTAYGALFGTRFDREVKVLVADVEEQSVLAAKQARQAKTVSRNNSERAAVHERIGGFSS